MWALRRASTNSFRVPGLNLTAFRPPSWLGPFGNRHEQDKPSNSNHSGFTLERLMTSNTCQNSTHFPIHFFVGTRSLSSETGPKSGGEGEDDLDEVFPEQIPGSSESELSDSDDIIEESLEIQVMEDEEVGRKSAGSSHLLKLILKESSHSISDLLDGYFPEGKDVNRSEVYNAMLNLKRRKTYLRALQLSEWLEKREGFDFTLRDYATRVDLIAKLRGIQKAEHYIDTIPKSHRQEVVYRTLLANCASQTNLSKVEEIFNKMKDLGFPLSVFCCNQLLIVYKRTDKKKIGDVLLLMEKEDIKPTLFTYKLLIDIKGKAKDIVGMEKVVETMEAEGVKPDTQVKATLARHYALGGYKEKAEEILKEIEGNDLKFNSSIRTVLLPIYALLGKVDDVERVWNICEQKPREPEFFSAIEAWGKLKNIEKAEEVYTMMTKRIKNLKTRHFMVMLEVYVQNKMLSKGKEVLKQMGESGCFVGPIAWDSIVRLYVDAGEVEKADSVLQKAIEQNPQKKPLFSSFMYILDRYAKRGDIHNSEKIFHRMRKAGYVSRASAYSALLQAYVNAKAPAYGFRERMKADNLFPNGLLVSKLAQVDAFKKNAVSDLLD